MRQPTRSTPKVFNASYQPPRKFDWSSYRGLKVPLLFLGLLLLIYLFTRLPVFQIKTVQIEGGASDQISDQLKKLVGQSIFSQNVTRRANEVKAQHIEVSDLTCSRGIPATLKCKIIERQPAAIWKSGSTDYVIDRYGIAYKPKTTEVPNLVIEDRAATAVAIGKNVISEDLLANYQSFFDTMKTYGFVVKNLFINESLYQFGAVVSGRTTPDQPYIPGGDLTVLVTVSYPIEAQIKTLRQILQERSTQIKERVDLRVPGYLYYY